MAQEPFTVEVKIGGKFETLKKKVLENPQAMEPIFQQWARIFTAFIRRRFDRASRGDGTWPPLAPSTIARRRKGRKGTVRKVSILRDTGLMFRQLAPELLTVASTSKSGAIFSSTCSFGNSASYPKGPTVSQVMAFHQKGGGRLPQRKIIVDPDAKTSEQMARAAKRIVTDIVNGK